MPNFNVKVPKLKNHKSSFCNLCADFKVLTLGTVVTPNKGTPNKGIFPYLTQNRQNGK